MIRIFLSVFVMQLAYGCSNKPVANPVPVPAGTTIEIYLVAADAGANTVPAMDSTSNTPINLVTPPVVTTVDIATVALSELEIETVGNAGPIEAIPSLEIVLNPAGATKMLNATTNPTSPQVAVAVNGVVISVPNIITPINRSFRVTGDPTDPTYLNAISAATGQP